MKLSDLIVPTLCLKGNLNIVQEHVNRTYPLLLRRHNVFKMNASKGESMLAWVERLDKAMNAANMNSITPAEIKLHLMIAKNPDNKF